MCHLFQRLLAEKFSELGIVEVWLLEEMSQSQVRVLCSEFEVDLFIEKMSKVVIVILVIITSKAAVKFDR